MIKISKDTNIKTYIRNGIETTESLLRNKHFVKAYQAVQELLKLEPENKKLNSLKKEIVYKINKNNEEQAKKHLESLEPLWREKKYKELIQNYKKLYKLVPNYKPLLEKLKRAQDLYLKEQKVDLNQKIENAIIQVKQYLNNKKFKEALLGAKELMNFSPTNSKLQALLKECEKAYANFAIKEIENEQSFDLDEKIKAYKVLSSLIPNYALIEELITKTQKLKFEQEFEQEKKEFNHNVEEIKGHLQQNEFNKAIKICTQLIKNNQKNHEVQKLLKKALKQKKKFVDKKTSEILIFAQKELKNEYNIDKKKFIKI